MQINRNLTIGLFVIALIINLIYFHFGLSTFGLTWENIYKIEGDATDYINSVENLLQGKGFTFFKTNEDTEFVSNFANLQEFDKGVFYAFRSPGFAFIYLPLRLIFNQNISLILMLFLQVALTALAKVYLAKISYILNPSKILFFLVFILINIIPVYSYYNNLIITDALGSAFLIFGIYLLVKVSNDKYIELKSKKILYIFSGLMLTIALMLRPFLIVFLLSGGFYILIKYWYNKRLFLQYVLVFSLPFTVINGVWVVRNYIQTNKFILLADTLSYQNHKHLAFFEMKKLSEKLNYSDLWWDGSSPVHWLVYKHDTRSSKEVFINNNPSIDFALIDSLKIKFNQSLDLKNSLDVRKDLELEITSTINKIHNDIKLTPIYYMDRLHGFLNQPNIRFFHAVKYPLNVVLVFLNSFIFRFIVYGSLIFMFLSLFRKKYLNIFMILLPTLFLLLFFGLHHQSKEYRFIYTFYPILLLISPFLLKEKYLFYRIILFIIILFSVLESIFAVKYEINW